MSMTKAGAERDYEVDILLGVIKTGEQGLTLRCIRGEEKFVLFFGKQEMLAF